MSYEPTVWQAGDTVTSAKLNKIEQGVASSGSNYIVECEQDETDDYVFYTTNTAEEIFNLVAAGQHVIFHIPESDYAGSTYITADAIKKRQNGAVGNPYNIEISQSLGIAAYYDNSTEGFGFALPTD